MSGTHADRPAPSTVPKVNTLYKETDNGGNTFILLQVSGVKTWVILSEMMPQPVVSQTVYVRKGGSDVTGDGTFALPFLTIQAAMTSIVDSSINKRYIVDVGPGEYADPFQIKPWVAVQGGQTGSGFAGPTEITAPADTCGFDPVAFVGSGYSVCWYSWLVFSNHQTWSYIAAGNNAIQITQQTIDFNGGATFIGNGTGGVANITWDNCLCYVGVTVTGWQFFFTIGGTQFLGGTVTINAGPAGSLASCTWLAQNIAVGAHFNPTNVTFHWAVPSPVGFPAKGDWTNTGLVGTMTLDGAPVTFVGDAVSVPPATQVVLLNGAAAPDYLRVPTSTGLALLGAAGTVVVANALVRATTRFVLSVNDGGPNPTGIISQSARVAGTSFTIRSSAGAGDAGVQVYWQLWEPTAT